MDLVVNPRNSPFASDVFFFKFATESDPQPKKNSTPPTSRKSIFSRSFDHITANFGPITSSSKRLGPVASQGDPLAHRDLRRLQRTFQHKWTHKSYQRLVPLRNGSKKWWRSFTINRMNFHKRLHCKLRREGHHQRILELSKIATWKNMRSYQW